MRGNRMIAIRTFLGVLLAIIFMPLICHADTAEVLPKGVFYFDTTYYHYFDINKRYNPSGEEEDLATDLNNKVLDSSVFPDLAVLDPFVLPVYGQPANIGRSEVDFTLVARTFDFTFYYGLTDKLSLGMLMPYFFLKNDVYANLDNANANVGKNPFINNLAPLYVPGTEPLTTDDAQDFLGDGLDINGDGLVDIEGYGFKRIENWSNNGIGDIELLARYQFFKNENWRLAFVGGVRLPTGEVDDPDSLVDFPLGDGQTDLICRMHADYIGIRNLLLNATIRYDIQLPDKEDKRVPDDVNQPLTRNKENVERDLGDILEFEVSGNYSFTRLLMGGLKYRLTQKFRDSVSGSKGFAYSSLEEETNYTSHMFFANLGYTTIPLYLEKKFPVPLTANLTYRNRFAGRNNVNKSEYISLSLTVFF